MGRNSFLKAVLKSVKSHYLIYLIKLYEIAMKNLTISIIVCIGNSFKVVQSTYPLNLG